MSMQHFKSLVDLNFELSKYTQTKVQSVPTVLHPPSLTLWKYYRKCFFLSIFLLYSEVSTEFVCCVYRPPDAATALWHWLAVSCFQSLLSVWAPLSLPLLLLLRLTLFLISQPHNSTLPAPGGCDSCHRFAWFSSAQLSSEICPCVRRISTHTSACGGICHNICVYSPISTLAWFIYI